MPRFLDDLNQRLASIHESGLYRELRRLDSPQSPSIRINGQTLLNFSSNDYLGLANDPILREAAINAAELYGAGSGASRLICGSLAVHEELEQTLATFKNVPAALTFSSGYAAAVGAISALMEKTDIVVIDKLVHASIVDAARLSGATLRVFGHNDLNALENILCWADHRRPVADNPHRPRVLIVTESIFSMDGDAAPLVEMVELKDRYGAWLMLDEAHATGLFGSDRRGWAEACGVADRVEIQMGTLSKAIGSSGGYICGPRPLIDFLINRARSFVFSTAPTPAAAAAATAAINFIQSQAGEQRCRALWERVGKTRRTLESVTSGVLPQARISETVRGAIIPLVIGDESRAMQMAAELRMRGIFIPAIRYPTVARGSARLRLTLSAAHQPGHIDQLREAFDSLSPSS